MSGTILVEGRYAARQRLAAALITAAVTAVITLAAVMLAQRQGMAGIGLQAFSAALALVVLWVLFPAVCRILPHGAEKIRWSLTDQALTLGETVIPLSQVRRLHCWQIREEITLNIETKGKNILLRCVDGELRQQSVDSLQLLAAALGQYVPRSDNPRP